jgi:glycosyltransferase involved in cell wall biosynthesis
MKVFGISMVRNEVDIVRANILHHLSLGLDQLLIIDNGSSDGTELELQRLGREDPRVRWSRDDGPYLQGQITTELAHEARRSGADWVLPIDADEFWYAPGRVFRRVLSESQAGALQAQVLNFIQRRSQRESTPEGLLHMTRRASSPVGPPKHAQDLVNSGKIAFVEKMYQPKWISRPTEELTIKSGNHRISGVDGPKETTDEIICLHAPIRSRASLEARIGWAYRIDEAGFGPGQSKNMRRWGKMTEETIVELEWAANSYQDYFLEVYGEQHPVIFDPRLRDVVSPWIPRPPSGDDQAV